MTKIQTLLSQVAQIYKHHKQMEYIAGDRFNIFKIIERTREEEGIHSRFIAELLNPKGSHGQGTIFLELFINKLQGRPQLDFETARVKIEKSIGRNKSGEGYTENSIAGDIDIYITDQKGIKVAIENKIDATDQPYQLRRYHNYTKQPVYYLNLDGHEPTEKSKSAEGLELDKDYFIISYQHEVIEWLEECRKESVNLPLLREGLLHYINLLKHLTNQSTNKAMETEIFKTLLQSSDTLQSAYNITLGFNAAKRRLQKDFWIALIQALEAEELKIKNAEKFTESALGDVVWNYYNKRGSIYPIEILLSQKDGLSFHWLAEIQDNFFTGFTVEKDGKGGISSANENQKYREILINQYPEYKTDSDNFIGWKYSIPQLNFREFNSDAIFSLADNDTLNDIVTKIAREAKRDIEWFHNNVIALQ